MPVTSLPIYGLRNRAGPGGFCRHMADLHTGLAAQGSPGSRSRLAIPARSPQGSDEVWGVHSSRSSGPGCRAERGGGALRVRLKPLLESEWVGRRRGLLGRAGIPVLRDFPKKAKIRCRRLRLPSPCLGAIPEN